jgi:allantoin racemase
VVALGTLDLGVDGGKSAVDIPVVGPTEACLHVASLISDPFGVMVYHPSLVAFSRAIIRRYGMEERIVGFGVSGFDLPNLAAHHDEVVDNFVSEAKRLVTEGAEVIYPMGISQCPVHINPAWLQEQLGVPVVEGIDAPIRMAALLAGVGLKQSRALAEVRDRQELTCTENFPSSNPPCRLTAKLRFSLKVGTFSVL